jgi:hypothetical protein
VPPFFSRNSGRFGLPSVDVLISRFKAGYERKHLLGSEAPGNPSQNPNTPAGLVVRQFSAIVLQKSRPSDSMPLFGGCKSPENFGTGGILLCAGKSFVKSGSFLFTQVIVRISPQIFFRSAHKNNVSDCNFDSTVQLHVGR